MPVRPNPLEINEVLSLIFSFLSQKTLRHVVGRVCHNWSVVAKRWIQHHVDLDPTNPKSWKDLKKKLVLASHLTVGRSIALGQKRLKDTVDEGQWIKTRTLLIQTLMEIDRNSNGKKDDSGLDGGHDQQKLRVESLVLHLEPWWMDPVPNLRLFNPLGLRDLKINVPSRDGSVALSFFLRQCPNLRGLALSAQVLYRDWDTTEGKVMSGSLLPNDNNNSRTHHPLRYLLLERMEVTPYVFITYLQEIGQLVQLSLVDIEDPSLSAEQKPDSFQHDEANIVFWESLAVSCPYLESIRLNFFLHRGWTVPTVLFPKVHQWGMYGGVLADQRSWEKVALQENRVTRLELLVVHWIYDSSAVATIRDECLHRFLCSSPLLLHLDTGTARPTLHGVLWGEDDPGATKIWACRGLRTLSMGFAWERYDDDTYPWSTRLFGYLGRVCPALQDLSLSIGYQVWPLTKGLCLLTRLHQLRRLELRTFGANSSDREPFQREDFAWIQGCTNQGSQSSSSSSSLSSSISGLKSLLLHRGSRPQPVDEEALDWRFAYYDYQYCLNKMRTHTILHHSTGTTLYNPYDVESDRSRIRQQQRLSDYHTDYKNGPDPDGPLPMVDGLQDFMIYGTFLDIEACLEARVFRVQETLRQLQELQHQKQEQTQQVMGGRSAMEIARTSQPWPELEQFRLTHEYTLYEPHDKTHHKNWGRALDYMKELRPEIDFQYQSFILDY